jgi:hypothetical protein
MLPSRAKLAAYRCDEVAPMSVNPRTGRPCRQLLIEAWSPEGALVRRRCKACGAWKVIEVRPAERVQSIPAQLLLD